ncbi:MAG: hypothetical protein MUF65_04020 [Rubritepida sp.]|jgi:hypothetical protein|nr:hypothetical protein [Rubritepida sp.]MCU0944519.1 hypothetical protein [Rubritepida sp.]
MGVAYIAERGLLAEDELAMVERSHYPALEGLDLEATQELAKWLRARRARARDIIHDRTRARRGKGALRGAVSDPGTAHNLADKKQVFARALKRVNARLDALTGEARRAHNAARLKQALARKQAAAASHPDAGASAARGMTPRSAPKRPGIVQGGRVGSVSQANKRRQAARDARG